MRRRISPLALIVALAAACGGDSSGPEEQALNQAASLEIGARLMSEIITIGFSSLYSSAERNAANADAGAARRMDTITITQTVPCAGGGTMAVQGTYTNDLGTVGTGSVAFELKQKPSSCVISTSQGAYTVNGDPELAVNGSLTVSNWNPGVFDIVYDGGFRWGGPGGSGGCSMDLTYHFNYATSSFTGTGHMCGYPIDYSYTP